MILTTCGALGRHPDSVQELGGTNRAPCSALQDIGFDGISPEAGTDDHVINRYFDVYFPRAIETARALRARNADLSYIFTTQVTWVYAHTVLEVIIQDLRKTSPVDHSTHLI